MEMFADLKMWLSKERKGQGKRWWAFIRSTSISKTSTKDQPPLET